MSSINIYKNLLDYDVVDIKNDNHEFTISLQGNGDLYFTYIPKTNLLDSDSSYKFYIEKDDYYLYKCLDSLYLGIINNKPFYNGDNINIKNNIFNNYNTNNLLINNNKITWYSDDFSIEDGSYLSIEKKDNKYLLEFSKSKISDLTLTYSVRIRNSGSRYKPYNVTFMNMYNKLRNYNYQIDIEEYLYIKNKNSR